MDARYGKPQRASAACLIAHTIQLKGSRLSFACFQGFSSPSVVLYDPADICTMLGARHGVVDASRHINHRVVVGLRYQIGIPIPHNSMDWIAYLTCRDLKRKLGINISSGHSRCIEARTSGRLVPHACLMVSVR